MASNATPPWNGPVAWKRLLDIIGRYHQRLLSYHEKLSAFPLLSDTYPKPSPFNCSFGATGSQGEIAGFWNGREAMFSIPQWTGRNYSHVFELPSHFGFFFSKCYKTKASAGPLTYPIAIYKVIISSVLIAQSWAHGIVKTPAPRAIGAVMKASCGEGPWRNINNNKYGPIENAVALVGADTKPDCDLWFCKGFKYQDNASNTRSYTAGQVVNFITDIENHHPGYVNVSIVSTTTKKKVAGPLISWPLWGVSGYPWPVEESVFNVTIPNLGTKCVTPGECVLMWFWYSPRNDPKYPNGVDQTYQSCIDFTSPAS